MSFIDNYLILCEENGVAPTRVMRDLGISHSMFVKWKSGTEPTNKSKKAIADYFGLTVAELSGSKIDATEIEQKKEAPEADSFKGLTEDEIKMLDVYRQVPDEYKAVAIDMIEAALKKK